MLKALTYKIVVKMTVWKKNIDNYLMLYFIYRFRLAR